MPLAQSVEEIQDLSGRRVDELHVVDDDANAGLPGLRLFFGSEIQCRIEGEPFMNFLTGLRLKRYNLKIHVQDLTVNFRGYAPGNL